MKKIKKLLVKFVKLLELSSALAVRLTQLTGKSKVPIHPKHLLTEKPWFTNYLKSKDLVLDLGSGDGQNSIKASKIARKVIGVEISEELLEIAKISAKNHKSNNIIFEKGNIETKLNFKDRTFDKIIFLDVLEHLRNREQTIKELRRILKNGGLMFLGVPNSQTSWKKFQRSAGINSFSDPDHKIEFTQKSIRKLLERHRFKIIHFGYGKYDIPARGLVDVAGALSLHFYRFASNLRFKIAQKHPTEASGFEIVASKK